MLFTPKKLHFHDDSREAFPEEKPVIDAVEQARKEVGYAPGEVLFKSSSIASAAPTVIPRAVDIIRYGMSDAVKVATAKGYSHSVVTGTYEKPSAQSGTDQANREIAASLRRMGFSS